MPKSRRCGVQKKRRRARRCMSRLSRARIRARRRLAPMRSSAPASRALFRRWKIPIRKWRGRVTSGCAKKALSSMSGLAPKRRDALMPATSRASRKGRPHVTLKLAISADGKAGLAGRKPAAITGEAARERVFQMRAASDAILVGIGTVSVRRSAIDLPSCRACSSARRCASCSMRDCVCRCRHRLLRPCVKRRPGSSLRQAFADCRGNSPAERLQGLSRRRKQRPARSAPGSEDTGRAGHHAADGRRRADGCGEFRCRRIWWTKRSCCVAKNHRRDGIDPLEGMPLDALTGQPHVASAARSLATDTIESFVRVIMFTGIVTDLGEVRSVKPRAGNLHRITIFCGYPRVEIVQGASIACSGVCLTVVDAGEGWPRLVRGRCGRRNPSRNDCRPLAAGVEGQSRASSEIRRRIGRPSGRRSCRRHRDRVAREDMTEMARFVLRAGRPCALHRPKGSVALDGVSLTVNAVESDTFSVLSFRTPCG